MLPDGANVAWLTERIKQLLLLVMAVTGKAEGGWTWRNSNA
ncbi:hypothetical protein PCAR4_840082 [Paraburkholderia caribensis]|nr:hypothetical protein PCAR4_840082 [Paraburkholderia caribensis]